MAYLWKKIKEIGRQIYKLVRQFLHIIATPFVEWEILFFLKIGLLILIIAVITLTHDSRATQNIKIRVNPLDIGNSIDSKVAGFSSDPELFNKDNLNEALEDYPAGAVRIFAPYDPGARMLVKIVDGKYYVLDSDNVTYNPGQEYHLEFRVNGSSLRLYIDNKVVFSDSDSTFSTGDIGLISSDNEKVIFNNVRITNLANDEVLYQDLFNDSDDSEWSNGDIPYYRNTGTWTSGNGRYVHEGKIPFVLRRAGLKNWRNYKFEVDVKPVAAGNPFDQGYIGIAARSQNTLNNYRFIWRAEQRQPTYSGKPWGVRDFESALDLADETNSPIVMVANTKGTPTNAANLVRQLNIVENRHIKYWEIGNEHYIWDDATMTASKYAQTVKQFSSAMKAVDPSIKIGAHVALDNSVANWERVLFQEANNQIDFVAVHYYPFYGIGGESYHQLMASARSFQKNYPTPYGQGMGVVDRLNDIARRYGNRTSELEVLVTEFNTGDENLGRSLAYGIATADLLGAMQQEGVTAGMFHGISVFGSHWGAFKDNGDPRPSALAVSLVNEHHGNKAIASTVTGSPKYSVGQFRNLPALSKNKYVTSYASRSGDKIYLLIINKHPNTAMQADIGIDHFNSNRQVTIYSLNGPSIYAHNESITKVQVSESRQSFSGNSIDLRIPAHSVMILEINGEVKASLPVVDPPQDTNKPPNNGSGGENITVNYKIAVARGAGATPEIKVFNNLGQEETRFYAYAENFRGGVRLASGDIDGDGQEEIIAGAGTGGGPQIRVFESNGSVKPIQFFAFHSDSRTGVDVACGDIDNDGKDEIAASQFANGEAWVKVYRYNDEQTVVGEWRAFAPGLEIGATVAMGDIDADNKEEVIVGAGTGGGPQIRVFEANGALKPIQFYAFHPDSRTGVDVATVDADSDGKDEIAVSQLRNGEAWTKIYRYNNERNQLAEFRAYPQGVEAGANIDFVPLTYYGTPGVITGPNASGGPQVRTFNTGGGENSLQFFAFEDYFRGGISAVGLIQ
ncbi:MAG: FG-GAP-like repeat-containing protein [bacterium]